MHAVAQTCLVSNPERASTASLSLSFWEFLAFCWPSYWDNLNAAYHFNFNNISGYYLLTSSLHDRHKYDPAHLKPSISNKRKIMEMLTHKIKGQAVWILALGGKKSAKHQQCVDCFSCPQEGTYTLTMAVNCSNSQFSVMSQVLNACGQIGLLYCCARLKCAEVSRNVGTRWRKGEHWHVQKWF